MNKIIAHLCFLAFICLVYVATIAGFASCAGASTSADPWGTLQDTFKPQKPVTKTIQPRQEDPWEKLRAVFLPFSIQEDQQAEINPAKAKTLADKIDKKLFKYEKIITQASKEFNIPKALLKSVIMAESGGNPTAKAKTTSAKGLMQTIDSTFKMARQGLSKKGIIISDNPYNPGSSILAGAWYLDRMYKKAVQDKKTDPLKRQKVAAWRYPLEYYYAGPKNGIKKANKIMVYSKGTRRIIDKRAYSKKIQNWAKILEAA